MQISPTLSTAVGLAAVAALAVPTLAAAEAPRDGAGPPARTYEVTVTNLTGAQPLSPLVAAAHRPAFDLFSVGDRASPAITRIAEDGFNGLAARQAAANRHVGDTVAASAPLARSGEQAVLPDGTVVTDSTTFVLEARPGDRLSLATMLICTNDGFTGLDAVAFPRGGAATVYGAGYDAGTEMNTQDSLDIVDPCSGLGPTPLPGDPDGNNNEGIDEGGVIAHHPGIATGRGELGALHRWTDPVIEVVVSPVG